MTEPHAMTGIGDYIGTGLWTAAVRAWETRRPDRIIADPYAAALASPLGARPLAPDLSYPVLRTRYLDDAVLAACRAGVRQLVLLGAGLDTRAFRLPLPPDVAVHEIDLPAVFDYKDAVLRHLGAAPRCRRVVVSTTLDGPWSTALADAGHDASAPTCWVAEGVLFYLSAAVVAGLLADSAVRSVPGSVLLADVVTHRTAHQGVGSLEPFLVHGPDDLSGHGWDVDTAVDPVTVRVGRFPGRAPTRAAAALLLTLRPSPYGHPRLRESRN